MRERGWKREREGKRDGGKEGEKGGREGEPYLEAGEAEEGPGEGVMVVEDVGLREGIFCLRQVAQLGAKYRP